MAAARFVWQFHDTHPLNQWYSAKPGKAQRSFDLFQASMQMIASPSKENTMLNAGVLIDACQDVVHDRCEMHSSSSSSSSSNHQHVCMSACVHVYMCACVHVC